MLTEFRVNSYSYLRGKLVICVALSVTSNHCHCLQSYIYTYVESLFRSLFVFCRTWIHNLFAGKAGLYSAFSIQSAISGYLKRTGPKIRVKLFVRKFRLAGDNNPSVVTVGCKLYVWYPVAPHSTTCDLNIIASCYF